MGETGTDDGRRPGSRAASTHQDNRMRMSSILPDDPLRPRIAASATPIHDGRQLFEAACHSGSARPAARHIPVDQAWRPPTIAAVTRIPSRNEMAELPP
jgi:hypothetical protein